MCGGDQLFGIGALPFLEPGAERILRVGKDTTVGGNGSFAVLESALPLGRCFAFHDITSQFSVVVSSVCLTAVANRFKRPICRLRVCRRHMASLELANYPLWCESG